MSPLLQINNLHKVFDKTKVLRGVSLSLEHGERRAIIGPNGAGKSTLFHLITGQHLPTSGEIHFDNFDITKLPIEHRARLGITRTEQSARLFLGLTVRENLLAVAQRGRGWFRYSKATEDQADKVAGKMGLRNLLNTPCKNLAHGDKRLLEIGISLAMRPKLLLLDEPMAGLSSTDRERVFNLLADLDDITLLFVEHDMESVFGLAERITVLHQGRALTEGSVDEVRRDSRIQEIYLGGRASNA